MIKSAVYKNERQKQVVLSGVPDENSSGLHNTIDEVLKHACEQNKPTVKDYCRVGAPKPEKIRPVNVCFNSSVKKLRPPSAGQNH